MEFRIEEAQIFLETRNLFNITYEQKQPLYKTLLFILSPSVIRFPDPISRRAHSALVIVKQPIRVMAHVLSVQEHVLV